MNEINISESLVEDIKFGEKEYFKIARAAALLKCESDDILHFGVLGKLSILSPVVCSGNYEWSLGGEMMYIPDLDSPFTRPFDPSDRVILSKNSLSHIEAIGWVSATTFSAPYAAMELIESAKEFVADQLQLFSTEHSINYKKDYGNLKHVLESFSEESLFSPWRLIKRNNDTDSKVTINHLLVSKSELTRLAKGSPQESKAIKIINKVNEQTRKLEHGNVKRNALKRESILRAALYCSIFFPKECNIKNFAQWAETIDEKALLFWPRTGAPPYKKEWISRYLAKVVDPNSLSCPTVEMSDCENLNLDMED